MPELSLDIDFKATLSPVQVFWWRSFLAYHKAAGNDDKLENVVPVVSDVSKILQKHVKLAVSEARITCKQCDQCRMKWIGAVLFYFPPFNCEPPPNHALHCITG